MVKEMIEMVLKVESKYLRYYKSGKYSGELEKRLGRAGDRAEWGFQYIGYWGSFKASTKQLALLMVVPQGCEDNEAIKKELQVMMPYIKPFPESSVDVPNIRTIALFEHTHGDDGSYVVGWDSDKDQWYLMKWYYGSCDLTPLTLDNLIKTIIREHYWIKEEDEDEDDV